MSTNFVPLEELVNIKRDAPVQTQPPQQYPHPPPYPQQSQPHPHQQYTQSPYPNNESLGPADDSQYAHESYMDTDNARYAKEPAYLKQTMYDRLQLPMLISILYYILQLPFIKHIFIGLGMESVCYAETGEITTEGQLIKSVCMGGLFYAIHTALVN